MNKKVVSLIILAFILGITIPSAFFAGMLVNKKQDSDVLSVKVIPSPMITPIPTESVQPTISPTVLPKAKANSAANIRVKELDGELAELNSKKKELTSYYNEVLPQMKEQSLDFTDRPEGYNPINDMNSYIIANENAKAEIKKVQDRIDKLNSERSSLLK